MKKTLTVLAVLLLSLIAAYFLGPVKKYEPVNPDIPPLNIKLENLDEFITRKEDMVKGIKPDNRARIIWADSVRKTEYSMVYLHGFSASPMEARPVHLNLAKKYGCNLYLARLSQHGLDDEDAFLSLTPKSYVKTAKEAIAIGNLIGEKTIVISCSTGGTLSLYLAANNPDRVYAQILFSPNIEIYDGRVKIVNDPWGEAILKQLVGDFREHPEYKGTEKEKYWTIKYRSEGIIALQDLLEQTMNDEVFQAVSQPYLLGYYYKNEDEQDKTVSVVAMLDFHAKSSTPDEEKRAVAFAGAGDHVIASDLLSKDYQSVQKAVEEFIEEVLNIRPVDSP